MIPTKDGGLDGKSAATVANANTTAGLLVVHRIFLSSGADGDTDVAIDHKVRVLDAAIVLAGAGTAGSTVTIKETGNAISDAVDVSAGADKAVFRPGTLDNGEFEIAASGTLRVSKASSGADFPGADVYVYCMRVA